LNCADAEPGAMTSPAAIIEASSVRFNETIDFSSIFF